MKTENMNCNFCPDGIYEIKEEFINVEVRGKNIKHQLHKCRVCGAKIMRGINEN